MATTSFLSEILSKNEQRYIGKYKAYPIYRISASWTELDKQLVNRINNSTSAHVMHKSIQLPEYIWNNANQWWVTIKSQKPELKRELVHLKCELIRYETWNTTWFCSESFNSELSNAEVLDSFEEYVRRYEELQNMPYNRIRELGFDYVCLMGAEDRWRWRAGFTPDGTRDDDYPAPCRCRHCQSAGMVRIAH